MEGESPDAGIVSGKTDGTAGLHPLSRYFPYTRIYQDDTQ